MDNRATEHPYPRSTDPASGAKFNCFSHFSNQHRTVNVGASASGGFFAPLQMELIEYSRE